MIEFNNCTYQHDGSILQAHDIFLNEELQDIEKAEKIDQILKEDTTDEEEIISRRMLLRNWPDIPSNETIIKAELQIFQANEKVRF